ncbi:MAG: NlpC/P60 family protein [Bacillota bacterium]|nr:NlpC/P60 family protein [Bacillota bacterium]
MKKRLACLSLIFAMAATQILPVSAARKDDVQAQKSETQNKLSEAEARANSLEEQKGAIMGQISSSEQELVDVLSQIDILAGEITDKEAEIEKTKEDLVQAEQDRDEQYEAMKKRIQYMYENGGSDAWAQILLESDSIASMLSKVENTEKMYAYDRAELKEMKEAVQEVKDLETKLENEKSELEIAKEEQEGMKGSLQTKIEDLKANASDYEAQIANVKAQAEQYKNLIAQQTAELEQIQAQEEAARKEQERQQKEAEQNKNNNNNNNSNNNSNNNKPSNNNSGNTNNKPSSNKPSNGGGSSKPEAEKPSKPSTPSTPSYNGATGEAVVAYAKQFIGNPYVYGGNSLTNGIDCSGFTQQIYGHFGYSLPRTSGAQASSGVKIDYSQHRAGDLIVYPGHVAILTGDGGIVHASNSAPYPKGGIKYTANALYRSPIAVRRIVQ